MLDLSKPHETVSTGYQPRPIQLRLHQQARRFNVVVCHRRFGKTVWAINRLIDKALRSTLPMPRFAYVAPTYGQAKRIAWDYLKKYTSKIPGVESHEQDLRVDIPQNKARIMLLSGENPSSLKGMYLDDGILDEYGEMNPQVWSEVIRPTLSDRGGGMTFIGTPKGQNNFYELRQYALAGEDPEWFTALFKASETGIIPEAELASARRQMTEEEYNQEYECDFNAGLVGAYFAKELSRAESEKRITVVRHDEMIPVDTYWDLGMNDTTAIWFVQTTRSEHRFIDHYEVCGRSLPDVIKDIKAKNYGLERLVLPHDAHVRDYTTGKTRVETLYSLGFRNVTVVPRVGDKMESINAARMIFSRCVFDAQRCAPGLKALANYQRKWNPKNNVFEESPLHNWASNTADAFQQFALGSREEAGTLEVKRRAKMEQAITDYDPYAPIGGGSEEDEHGWW